MGDTPQDRVITVGYNCQFEVQITDCSLSSILDAFGKLLLQLLADFIQQVLVHYGDHVMTRKIKPFACECCGNNEAFTWKTKHGKDTKLLTFYGWLVLQQLQVLCKKCKRKMSITRKLLGVEAKKRIPAETYRKLGLMGALGSFRVMEKVGKMFGWTVDKMTIWHAVQKTGSEIDFKLDGKECARGESDGTGIGIKGIAKRGKELKVFIQHKKDGGVRVAGIDIGNYNGSWDKVFKNSLEVFKSFRGRFLLVTDGDTTILDGLKDKVKIIVQRCLWHIPYQAQYVLWQDEVKRKSEEWLYVVSALMEICAIRPFVDCKETIGAMIRSKKDRLEEAITHCRNKGYEHTATYLENAKPDMFTAFEKRLNGKTTSRVERLMRTVNMRVNVSKWSETGALNAMKIRLAYYYNGFDA